MDFAGGLAQGFSVPARGQVFRVIPGPVRVVSTEPLAAIERFGSAGKLGTGSPQPVAAAETMLVFPCGITGGGYTSILVLANAASGFRNVTVSFGAASRTVRMEGRSALRLPLAEFLSLPAAATTSGPVRVSADFSFFGTGPPSLTGVLDIENASSLTTIGQRPASRSLVFPHVAHGGGLFAGLAIAAGGRPATVTMDVLSASGAAAGSATITIPANQSVSRLISELTPAVTSQTGGYIRIRSDEPVWAWEILESGQVIASVPPL
jgi:hypothetical protein